MVASNVISVLCLAAAFVTAHPINEQLAARQFGSITSTQSASSSYQSLTNQIRTLRENIAAGRVSVSEARSQFQSFSSQASSTFSAINGCSTCFTSSSAVTIFCFQSSLSESARQTYSELDSLIDTSNRVYGQQAPTVLSPFSNLDSQFQQNLNLFSQSGVGLQSIVPPTFTNNLSRVGLSQTANYASHYVGGSSGF
ncbi:uncharacterized protein VP01_1190g3 [Puccinia sorghi]|uniref:Uncharacterized protein n=1 Tax=Puccinia sorghi TaxID=27349 RepID=A0A0L6VQT9_9BASI|nr:uncharacterized protein VP01_1190g3 [Puccinia sorghi]